MEKIKVEISWLDNYGVHSEQVAGCVATADTIDKVKEGYTLAFHLEGMKEDRDEIPEFSQNSYELDFELNAQALLKYLNGKLTRAAISRITDIAEKQLGHYITGHRTPRPAQRTKIVEGIKKTRIRPSFGCVVIV